MYVLDKSIPPFLGIGYERGLWKGMQMEGFGDTPVSASDVSTNSLTPDEVEWLLHNEGYYELTPATTTPAAPSPTANVNPYVPTPVNVYQAPVSKPTVYRYDAVKYGVDRAIWKWELQNARGLGVSLWDAVVNYAIDEGNKYLMGLTSGLSGNLSGLGADTTSTWDWSGWSYILMMVGNTLTMYGQYRLQQTQIDQIKNQVQQQTGTIPGQLSTSDYEKAVQAMKAMNPNLSEEQIRTAIKDVVGQSLPSGTGTSKQEWLIPALLIAGVILLTRR